MMPLRELSRLVVVVSKHDPAMQMRLSAVFDRKESGFKRAATVTPKRKGRKT